MNGCKLTIGESTLAELIITSVLANNDFETFHCLARVSRRFNRVAKSKLIKKEDIIHGYRTIWTELSGGAIHGRYQEWFDGGQISYDHNYRHGKKHGVCKSWWGDGTLHYSIVYDRGKEPFEK